MNYQKMHIQPYKKYYVVQFPIQKSFFRYFLGHSVFNNYTSKGNFTSIALLYKYYIFPK